MNNPVIIYKRTYLGKVSTIKYKDINRKVELKADLGTVIKWMNAYTGVVCICCGLDVRAWLALLLVCCEKPNWFVWKDSRWPKIRIWPYNCSEHVDQSKIFACGAPAGMGLGGTGGVLPHCPACGFCGWAPLLVAFPQETRRHSLLKGSSVNPGIRFAPWSLLL